MTNDNATALPKLPPRPTESHKGDFGRALLVGGSSGMAGAVALAGMAALRSGAGLVTLAVPRPILSTVASLEPSYMTVALPADAAGRISAAARETIEVFVQRSTAVACGPGLHQSNELNELVGWLYTSVDRPMIVDADGLNALAMQRQILPQPGGPRIITPHPGEFARLAGRVVDDPQKRSALAVELARELRMVIVLKGHATLVTDGTHSWHNTTGNPGMATGGTGDVLTGVITALVCQGMPLLDAARLGVYVHGLAGDLAAAELGEVSLIASDLPRFLPAAFQQLAGA